MGSLTDRFQGQHIAITGASRGLGRAIALRLAHDGATLSLLGRNAGLLEGVANECEQQGAAAVHVSHCNLLLPETIHAAVEQCTSVHGPLQAFVANAGIGGPNAPGEKDRFEELLRVNVVGTYHSLRAAQRQLASGPAPRHLLVVSSVLARIGVSGYTGYCASKAALLGLVRALAVELAPRSVQVNAICPGWIDTDMAREGIEQLAQNLGTSYKRAFATAMESVPLGRMSTPAEIANVVAWLLSSEARGITGQGIDINGGSWMG